MAAGRDCGRHGRVRGWLSSSFLKNVSTTRCVYITPVHNKNVKDRTLGRAGVVQYWPNGPKLTPTHPPPTHPHPNATKCARACVCMCVRACVCHQALDLAGTSGMLTWVVSSGQRSRGHRTSQGAQKQLLSGFQGGSKLLRCDGSGTAVHLQHEHGTVRNRVRFHKRSQRRHRTHTSTQPSGKNRLRPHVQGTSTQPTPPTTRNLPTK